MAKSSRITKCTISRRAYEDLVIYASRYASNLIEKEDQREVYGILVGRVDDSSKSVFITQAIGIVVGERTGVEFENKEYVDLSQIDERVWKHSVEYKKGDFICGWWHTHPGFGFFYSDTDTMNHIGFQTTNPFAVGIIYDYTQRKAGMNDPGIEVLTLDDANKGQMASFEFVNFAVQDLPHALDHLDHSLKDTLKKLSEVQTSIHREIYSKLEKRDFAQIQRNYGLLLVKKSEKKNIFSIFREKGKDTSEIKDMSDEDRWLYEWNENDIKKRYRIPKFRKKIEKKINHLRNNDRGDRGIGQHELEEILEKPLEKVNALYHTFLNQLDMIKPFRRWMDADERLILSHFNEKITQYIQILNALISKTYHLLPHFKPLKEHLFDESILDNVFYGQEEEFENLQSKLNSLKSEAARMIETKFPALKSNKNLDIDRSLSNIDQTSKLTDREIKTAEETKSSIEKNDDIVNAIVDSVFDEEETPKKTITSEKIKSQFKESPEFHSKPQVIKLPTSSPQLGKQVVVNNTIEKSHPTIEYRDKHLSDKPIQIISDPELNTLDFHSEKQEEETSEDALLDQLGIDVDEDDENILSFMAETITTEIDSSKELDRPPIPDGSSTTNHDSNILKIKVKSNEQIKIPQFGLKPVEIQNTKEKFDVEISEEDIFEDDSDTTGWE